MRIALIHTQYRRKGGAETYFLDLVHGFAAQGHQVDVFVFKQDRQEPVPTSVTVHCWRRSWYPKPLRKWCFARWVKKQLARQHYDLTIANTRTMGQQLMICGGCHAAYLERLSKQPTWRDRVELALETQAYDSSACIIAHSKQVGRELAQHYPQIAHKIRVVYPPCDTQRFRLQPAKTALRIRDSLNVSGQKTVLLFPASGNPKMKGLDLLLDAFAQLPTDRYVLWLAGSDLKTSHPNVQALGFVSHMPELMAAADFVVLPSYYEAFGLVIIEALACGTPVIASAQVGATELLTPECGLVYDTQDATVLVQAIETAMKTRFTIEANFCQSQQLTIDQHLTQLQQIAQECTA